jgi:uncharacterized protein (DUF433 family)
MTAAKRPLTAEVISDPTVMSGEPVIRGTRVPAATIAAYPRGRPHRQGGF